jgi:hypothetical protein
MIQNPDADSIFNLHRELFFILHTHIKSSGYIFTKKKHLTWKGDPLLMVANSHPLKSVVCALCISLTPRTHFPPTEHLFYMKTTLTSPILLLSTMRNILFKWTHSLLESLGFHWLSLAAAYAVQPSPPDFHENYVI